MRVLVRVFLAFALAIVVCAGSAAIPQAHAGSSRTTTPVVRLTGKADSVTVTTTFTTATFATTTNVPTTLTVATGTDKANLVSTPDPLKSDHVVTVAGLSPDTTYYGLVTATPVKGTATKQWVTFTTAAPGSAPATVTTQGNRWLLNGQRFIPITSLHGLQPGCVTPDLAANDRMMGIEALLIWDPSALSEADCVDAQGDQIALVHAALAGQMWWQYDSSVDTQAGAAQVPEQAEMVGWPASGSGTAVSYGGGRADISQCWGAVDPSWKAAYSDWYDGFASSLKPGRPSTTEISTEEYLTHAPHHANCLIPSQLAWEFWGGIGHGSDIRYITEPDNGTGFDVAAQLQAEAGMLAAQLATLGPVLNWGTPVAIKQARLVPVKLPSSIGANGKVTKYSVVHVPPVALFAWRYGGRLYVLAINPELTLRQTANAIVKLPGAAGGTVKPLWNKASLTVKAGTATVRLGGLTAAWFQIAPDVPKT